uniref:Peroxidase n=1 Tax=Panagrolaimus superbus TaxID=310955 RepID=A0A914YH67_9BILA
MAKLWLAFGSLFLVLNAIDGSHISCGKSFIPCDVDPSLPFTPSISAAHPRVYGISSAQFQRQQVPEPLIRVTANEAMREVHQTLNDTKEPYIDPNCSQWFDFKDATFDLFPASAKDQRDTRIDLLRMPLASAIKQYCFLHPMSAKAKAFSEAAFVSSLMALRLKNLGLRESEITIGLDPKILMKSVLGDICPRQAIETCADSEYRTLSGSCNNVKNSLWGTSYEPFQRLTSAYYSDGIQSIRDSKNRQTLPNTRELSLNLFENPSIEQTVVNEMIPFWLYFIASDLGEIIPNQYFTPYNNNFKPFPCCDASFVHPDCLPIHISSRDFFYSRSNVSCLPYTRSLPAPRHLCRLGHREQINTVTSFLDASTIYGSSKEQMEKLRTSEGGLLITSSYGSLLDLLPQDVQSNEYCQSPTRKRCFLSGTSDTNILPEISALHMLFVRQHNALAKSFK